MEPFWIGPKIGRGVVGTSYDGMLKSNRLPVVVKVISRRFHDFPELLDEVLEDLRSWIGFQHPNAGATRDVGVYQDRNVVLFDKVPGTPLSEYLDERGAIEPRMALMVVRDVLLALSVAHQGDMPVGDVRASKIYFDGRRAVLTDLGLARGAALGHGFGRFGLHFGHPEYLAPEVPQEGLKRPTRTSDVYAVGILLYQLLTGKVPFRGDPQEVLKGHLQGSFEPPAAIAGNKQLRTYLARMLAKDPKNRYPDAESAVAGLYEIYGQAPPSQDDALMSTKIWRRRAAADADVGTGSWSADRVMNADPVGPDLGGHSSVSGRIPRPASSMMASKEIDAPREGVKLGEKIARGPSGTVYEGELAGYTGPVVVKVLSSKYAAHEELNVRIMARLEQSTGLCTAEIAGLLRIEKAQGRHLLVFDKVEGGKTLRHLLAAERVLSADRAMDLGLRLARALATAQMRGLPHGDLRPEKVLIDPKGRVRLTDFGLCEASCLGAGFGQFGIPFGHPTYLAPEVIQEQGPPTFAADCYALGIMLYELVSGMPPFQGPTPRKTLVLHLEQPLPPPPKNVKVPAPLAELILRLTSKDPVRRPDSALVLQDELRRCQRQVQLAGSGELTSSIEEFDPTSGGLEGTTGLWESEETILRERASDWKTERIQKAKPIGPNLGKDPQLYQSEDMLPGAEDD